MNCGRADCAGFTLIEVMVALIVISVGVLGIAATQALAFGRTHTSRTESLVALEAQSLSDAMQANPAYWRAGLFPSTEPFIVNGLSISDSSLNSQTTNCAATSCTPIEMASFDLRRWGNNLQVQAPGATGSINCQAGSPSLCVITVQWTQKASTAINSGSSSASAAQAMSYSLVSQF